MDDIYLDSNKKKDYYSDFVENVLPETDSFWKISDSIKTHLIELNACDKIQPLYSKFPDNRQSLDRHQSYFEFAYVKDIELILLRQILPYFMIRYSQDEEKCYYTFSEPKDNPNFRPDSTSRFKFGCLKNPDYFRINHLRLAFEAYNKDRHKEFWGDLTNELKKLCTP